jgi:transcriptional regulator with XRE-family HTH domain
LPQEECDHDNVSPSNLSSHDSLRKRIDSILAGKKLTLNRVSKLSESVYGRASEYFIPHNFYYELGRGAFTPSIFQFVALSRISGYRLADWLKIFRFDLEDIARFQVLLPAKRTVLIDSSLADPETRVRWLQDKTKTATIPRVAPLSQVLELHGAKRIGSVGGRFVYAKVGGEDALVFPDLLPGSIVGFDTEASFDSSSPSNKAGSRLFLVEHSKGLFCCRLRRISANRIVPVSEKLPFGQIELEVSREAKILGTANFEIRSLVDPRQPEVPADLARRWTPGPLPHTRGLGQLLRSGRERLKISLQTASSLTSRVADALGEVRYFISPSSLSDYEAGNAPPRHFHKVVSLCVIYGLRFGTFLAGMGISSVGLGKEPMPEEFLERGSPLRADEMRNDFRAKSEGFLGQLLGIVPEVPFFLRNSLSALSGIRKPSLADFLWIGGETSPLHPFLKEGIIAMVNRRKKRPIHYRAKPLWEQPIYVLLLRGGSYLCACCSLEDHNLVLHPYPQHVHGAIHFRDQQDAEVVGQIVVVMRKLL